MIRQGQFHPGPAVAAQVRTLLNSTASTGTDNSAGPTTGSFAVAAGSLIIIDFTREGTGDIDANGSAVTNNKGLTFVKQSSVAAFMSTPGKWYRIERWWAYSAAAQTGMTCTIQFNKVGVNNTYATQISVYSYSGVPQANGGSPFYAKNSANPATASNTTNVASAQTVTADPQGINSYIILGASVHRDTGNGASLAGTGFNGIHSIGNNSSSGLMTFVNEDLISSSIAGATKAVTFTVSQTCWLLLEDVIDTTALPTAPTFVVVGASKMEVSDDAITWYDRTPPALITYNAITYSSALALWVAVGTGSNFATSPDGITWTARTAPQNATWNGVAYSPSLVLFAAICFNTTSLTFSVATSPDGVTWTGRTSLAGGWTGICWDATHSLFIAVADSGTNKIMTSPDGITWTARTQPTALAWKCVAVSNAGVSAALSTDLNTNGGMSSANGTTWAARAAPLVTYRAVAWSQAIGVFLGVGDTFSSPATNYDATGAGNSSWSGGSLSISGASGVCWSASKSLWVICFNNSSTRIATSPTSATYTARVDFGHGSWKAIACKG
jgi:hypothetical protein